MKTMVEAGIPALRIEEENADQSRIEIEHIIEHPRREELEESLIDSSNDVMSSLSSSDDQECLSETFSVEVATLGSNEPIQVFLEEMLEHTFSLYRRLSCTLVADIEWLLHLINHTIHLMDQEANSSSFDVYYKNLSFGICKFYLSRLLISSQIIESANEDQMKHGFNICSVEVMSLNLMAKF